MVDIDTETFSSGRVLTYSFIDDTNTSNINTFVYTTPTYDYSLIPDKPANVSTNPTWWETTSQLGQTNSLTPLYFADALFHLRNYDEPVPSRPVNLKNWTLARETFNRIQL